MSLRVVVGPSTARVVGAVSADLHERLLAVCSYPRPGAEYAASQRGGGWGKDTPSDRISLYSRSTHSFPAGLVPLVAQALTDRRVPYVVEEQPLDATRIRNAAIPTPNPAYEAREYQRDAVSALLNERRGIARMATGAGKTVVAGHLMYRHQKRTAFLVHTKDLLYQAHEAFEAMFGVKVGIVGDGLALIEDITVCTIQTLARAVGVKVEHNAYEEELDQWDDEATRFSPAQARSYMASVGVVFMDECHRVAAPMASSVVRAFEHAPHRYGLSASPWRDDGADIVLQGVLGEVLYDISASTLIQQGYLVPPIIRMHEVQPRAYEFRTPYAHVYEDYIVENDDRNYLVLRAAMSLIQRGRPTLVLVRRISHGQNLAAAIYAALDLEVPFLSGDDPSQVRRDAMDDMRQGRLACIVATTIADEGLDIKPLSGLVLAGGGKSSTRALQRVGRTLRPFPGKVDAEIHDFTDNARYLLGHSMAREGLYKTEPEYTILDL